MAGRVSIGHSAPYAPPARAVCQALFDWHGRACTAFIARQKNLHPDAEAIVAALATVRGVAGAGVGNDGEAFVACALAVAGQQNRKAQLLIDLETGFLVALHLLFGDHIEVAEGGPAATPGPVILWPARRRFALADLVRDGRQGTADPNIGDVIDLRRSSVPAAGRDDGTSKIASDPRQDAIQASLAAYARNYGAFASGTGIILGPTDYARQLADGYRLLDRWRPLPGQRGLHVVSRDAASPRRGGRNRAS